MELWLRAFPKEILRIAQPLPCSQLTWTQITRCQRLEHETGFALTESLGDGPQSKVDDDADNEA